MAYAKFNTDRVIRHAREVALRFSKQIEDSANQDRKNYEEEVRVALLPKWWRPWKISRLKAETDVSNRHFKFWFDNYSVLWRAELKKKSIQATRIEQLARTTDRGYIMLTDKEAELIFANDESKINP